MPGPRPAVALALGAVLWAVPAQAQTEAAETQRMRLDWPVEAAVTAGAIALSVAAWRLPVDTSARWRRELLGDADEGVKKNFSASAARASDRLLLVGVLAPLPLQFAQRKDGQSVQRSFVYLEAMAVGIAVNTVTKWAVARPRPYVYSSDPQVEAWARRPGRIANDSHLSFYSGHASSTFGAAVAGSYLFARSTNDIPLRTGVWAGTLAVAAATANLRVRAGRHFYSDVLVGALVGTAIGWFVPAVHYDRRLALATSEWVAIGTAPLAGAMVSQVLPFGPGPDGRPVLTMPTIVPWAAPRAAGLGLGAAF